MKAVNSDPIRVPRTTVLFVTVLWRILREQMGFRMFNGRHEHWEFFKTASWETYQQADRPSDDEEGDWSDPAKREEWNYYHFLKNSLDHRFDVYVGIGDAQVYTMDSTTGKIEIRTKIEHDDWFATGIHGWTFSVWAKLPSGEIKKAVYQYADSSEDIFEDKEAVQKPLPPQKISFDKKGKTEFEKLTKFQATKIIKG